MIARTTYRNAGFHNGGNGSTQIDPNKPYFVVTAAGASLPAGYEVQKVGFVTGWTWGTVGSTCVDHQFHAPGQPWYVYYVTKCNYEANINHNAGDSGGPFFTWDGGDQVTLLGTLVGATNTTNAVYSPYTRIIAELGGTFNATRGVNLPAPSGVSGSISASHPMVSWSATPNATRYNVRTQYWVFVGYDEYSNPIYESRNEHWGNVSSTSFTDASLTVVSGSCAWWDDVFYWIQAASNTDVSPYSSGVHFCRQS